LGREKARIHLSLTDMAQRSKGSRTEKKVKRGEAGKKDSILLTKPSIGSDQKKTEITRGDERVGAYQFLY